MKHWAAVAVASVSVSLGCAVAGEQRGVGSAPAVVIPYANARFTPVDPIEERAPVLGPGSYCYQPGMQPHSDSCLSDSCVMYITWSGRRDAFRAAEGN